jgi:DNA-binding NarL/FixJ family response regulator
MARVDRLLSTSPALHLLSIPAEPCEWPKELSAAEREVTRLLIRGWCYEDIARRRGVSRETVSAQIRAVLRKLGVDSTPQLVAYLACLPEEQDG